MMQLHYRSMDPWPQTSDPNAAGFYTSVGNGYWAINLSGNGSILNETGFSRSSGYIFVEPYFVWADQSSTFIVPSRTMVWYDNSSGAVRYILDTEPIQTGRPIIRLRVMVIHKNPDAIHQ